MTTQEQVLKALTENIEYMKYLRDKYEEEGNTQFSNECHLIWYWLACSLDGISFKPKTFQVKSS